MKLSLNHLTKFSIQTKDGHRHPINDILINEDSWEVDYIKIDNGSIFQSSFVLIPHYLVRSANTHNEIFELSLTRDQLSQCPSFSEFQPISRLLRHKLDEFYLKEDYWARDYYPPEGIPNITRSAIVPATKVSSPTAIPKESEIQSDLRSFQEVLEYDLKTNNGKAGKIHDFIIESESWEVISVVVKLKHYGMKKKVLTASHWITNIDSQERVMELNLSQSEVRKSPRFDIRNGVNRLYQNILDFRGKPVESGI